MSQNIQEDKYKRAVNFDLNTAELKKIFSSPSPLAYLQGYRQIGRMLPWLQQCVRKFDVTSIGSTFDLIDIFKQPNMLEEMRESVLLIEKNSAPASVEQSDKEKSPAFNMQLLHDNAPIAQEIYEKSSKQQTQQNKRSKNQEL